MSSKKKSKIYIIDTSAILSGIPINFDDAAMVTTSSISMELKPGGRDYRAFQFLIEKGLSILSPSKKSRDAVNSTSRKTGDEDRLSKADVDVLALALDMKLDDDKDAVILTDDYSIQNVADALDMKFGNIGQPKITKRFKWGYQCLGCGKKFKENIKICPICGAATKNIILDGKDIKRRKR
ncbi:MAG: NOB1 family endonuclease [Thermoplasmatales archaeon]|nr:NOB1 family endonuclease [Thermoplasmatales archaeon]